MVKRLLLLFLSISIIITLATSIIFYGRGYRFDPEKKEVSPTGILSVSSYPEKASIYVNDKLKSATNASFSLPPGWYHIRVAKDGYQSWEKRMRIQGEVVSQIDALLIPNNPSLKALTSAGIFSPTLSPSSTKVAYFIDNADSDPATLKSKNGLYVLELRSGTLGNKPEAKQIFIANRPLDYTGAKIFWSDDEKEIIIAFYSQLSKSVKPIEAFILSVDNPENSPVDITLRIDDILNKWQAELQLEENLRLLALPDALTGFLTENTDNIKFSPDESKIFYQATNSAQLDAVIIPPIIGANPTDEERLIKKNKIYVYDIKEDRNFFIKDTGTKPDDYPLPVWYTDSKHLVLIDKDRINIVDYDGTNKRSVYSGPFSGNIVFPWSPGGKIVILTNFNSERPKPDLYEVDLR